MHEGNASQEQTAPRREAIDPRLLQANERTLLAWLRTGIALMTFGFVIARIGVWLQAIEARRDSGFGTSWIGAAFVALGVAANGMAVRRFGQARRFILAGESLPGDRFPVLFGIGVTILGALLGGYVLSRLQ
jgi:putative membrane protein